MLSAGAKTPLFTLLDLKGSPHSLAEILENGPVLLALYKISCPVCQLTMPFIERISNGASPSSLQVIAISQDDEGGTSRFRQKFGLTMATLLDREEDGYPVSNAFGIRHVPSLFLVERDRTISLASNGFNKRDLEEIAKRAGSEMFRPEDHVPEWKAG